MKMWLEKNIQYLNDFWEGKSVSHYPIAVWGYSTHEKPGRRDCYFNSQLDLKRQLVIIEDTLNDLPSPDKIFIPTVMPTFGNCAVLPSGFGAEVSYPGDAPPWIKTRPVQTLEEAAALKIPTFHKDGLYPQVLERLEYFAKETGEDVVITGTPMQGPLTNACLILGTEKLLMGMYDRPELAKRFLRLLADTWIAFCKLEQSIVEGSGRMFSANSDEAVWNHGIGIPADESLLVSSDMYKEFVIPCDQAILDYSGGGIVHNCGPILPSIDAFMCMRNCWGINFNLSINREDLPQICQKLKQYNGGFSCANVSSDRNLIEDLEYLNRTVKKNGSRYVSLVNARNKDELIEIYSYWEKYCTV